MQDNVKKNFKKPKIRFKYHLFLVLTFIFFYLIEKIKYSNFGKKKFFGPKLFKSSKL